MKQLVLEVGKLYKNGQCEVVEIIHDGLAGQSISICG